MCNALVMPSVMDSVMDRGLNAYMLRLHEKRNEGNVMGKKTAAEEARWSSFERVPPHSQEAELACLGAVVLEPKAMAAVASRVKAVDFYRYDHQLVFQAAIELFTANEPVDVLTLREKLRAQGHREVGDNSDLFMQLAGQVPSVANAEYYAGLVKGASQLRGLVLASHTSAAEAWDTGLTDAQEVIDKAMQRLLELQQERQDGRPVKMDDVVSDVIGSLMDGDNARSRGVSTGYPGLDGMTLGLHGGELTVLAGPPSSGKTTLALNIMTHASMGDPPVPVLMFSAEMGREQVCQNMLCISSGVGSHQLRTGRLVKKEWTEVKRAANRIYKAPFWIDDSPGLSIVELRAKARAHIAEHQLGLVVVDYLQLLKADVGRQATKEQEIEAISHGLKHLARELKVPVLALSQLNRPIQEGMTPRLSRLRGSGAIEQDADMVLFLHHKGEELASDYVPQEGLDVELMIAKQRNGPRGSLPFTFFQHCFTFREKAMGMPPDPEE